MNNKPTTGFVQPAYGRYGRQGWNAFIVGLPVFWTERKADANEWVRSHGCDPVS